MTELLVSELHQCFSSCKVHKNPLKNLFKNVESGLANLEEGGPRLCIFEKLPGEAYASSPRTKFQGVTTCTALPPKVAVRFK